MLGFAEEEMVSQRVHALIHHSRKDGSNYPVEDCPMYASYTKATKSHVTEEALWRKDGSSFPVDYSSMPIKKNGRVIGAVVTFRDITKRKWAEEALQRSEVKFRTLYDSTSDAVMLLDKKGFFDCNKATLAIFGCATREEFCKKHPGDLSPQQQPCGTDSMVLANQMIATAMKEGNIHFGWMHKRNDTGETFPADVLLTAMELDGKPVVQAVVRDITELKRSEEKMEFLAAHDVLTGLLNRRSLEEMLIRTIAKAKRGMFSSLLYMDLDNFKNVNDTVGHAAGDEVLITLAGLSKDAVRTEDIVFRLGGDEFAVLLEGTNGRDALSVAERLRSVVETHPFEQEGQVFPLSLSIGLIEIDGTLATGELMSQADAAMYRAKAQGKNKVVMAKPDIPAVADMMEAIESH
jgi:diguanylate cyclase (GGDEF)-like protein/PAS domain S-box-containing protein